MYIPDLFGAYIKGRELAIEKNWQDLRNYETIENMRNVNDLQAIEMWRQRQKLPGEMSMYFDNVRNISRANEVAEEGHDGMMAYTRMLSDDAIDNASIYAQLRPQYRQQKFDLFANRIDQQAVANGVLASRNAYYTPERQYQMGQWQGSTGYNNTEATALKAGHAPTVARQLIRESDLTHGNNVSTLELNAKKIANADELLPAQHKLSEVTLGNLTAEAEGYQATKTATAQARKDAEYLSALETYTSYLRLAMAGDQSAMAMAQVLDAKYNFTSTAGGTVPTTGTADVGTESVLAPTAQTQPHPSAGKQTTAQPASTPSAGRRSVVIDDLLQGRSERKTFPVAPGQGVYAPRQVIGVGASNPLPPVNTNSPYLDLFRGVGVSYLPAIQVVK